MPTYLTHVILSARGFSPRRPDAVMSTAALEIDLFARIFKGRRMRSRCAGGRRTIPVHSQFLPAIGFHCQSSLDGDREAGERTLPGACAGVSEVVYVAVPCGHGVSEGQFRDLDRIPFRRPGICRRGAGTPPIPLFRVLPTGLGPTNSRPIDVLLKPFAASAFKVLV